MKVIILGKGEMLANLIEGTLLSGAEIVGVIRYEKLFKTKIRLFWDDLCQSNPTLTLMKKYNINDINLKSANSESFKNLIVNNNVDIVLVGTWAEKIRKEIFNAPKIGTINVHPSLLPKYRGPNPYLQAIWHGETHSGITFHLMTEKYDAGNILAQARIKIYEQDTGKELRTKTTTTAKFLCAELLKDLQSNCVVPTPQDENQASYYPEIAPQDMTLNFAKESSKEILLHVRAFHPFRPTYIQEGDDFWIVNPYKVFITEQSGNPGEIIKKSKSEIQICAKDGIALSFKDIKKYNRLFKFI